MPPKIRELLTALLAVAFLAAFSLATGNAFVDVAKADRNKCVATVSSFAPETVSTPTRASTAAAGTQQALPPQQGSARDYVVTLIAALVAGVVAVAFGLPERQSYFGTDRRGLLISAYAGTYFLAGLIALGFWTLKEPCAGIYVKNLAATFLGTALAIVGNYLKANNGIRGDATNR